jgi:hypothetical protein
MSRDEYDVVLSNIKDTNEAPKDKNLYYRCRKCGGVIPSIPRDNIGCECGNVFIDLDFWRLVIEDYSMFEVVKRRNIK